MFSTSRPSIGIFIMPGKTQTGALERLCLQALSDNPLMNCVDAFAQCVLTNASIDEDKLKLGAYVASIPGVRLVGEAARARKLSFEHAVYEPIKEFLFYPHLDGTDLVFIIALHNKFYGRATQAIYLASNFKGVIFELNSTHYWDRDTRVCHRAKLVNTPSPIKF